MRVVVDAEGHDEDGRPARVCPRCGDGIPRSAWPETDSNPVAYICPRCAQTTNLAIGSPTSPHLVGGLRFDFEIIPFEPPDGPEGEGGVPKPAGMPDASREEMVDAYGPFAILLEPHHDERTLPYTTLFGLGPASAKVLRSIRVAASEPDAERCIVLLLRDANWGAQIVGAVAAYVRPSDAAVDHVWRALDSGSWVSPELAAVASLVDPAFVARALDRLDNHCGVILDSDYVIEDPLERLAARGPGSS